MWTPEGTRPIVTVTWSHQRTCVFVGIVYSYLAMSRLKVIGIIESDLVQFNHDMSSHAYIRHLLSSESLKISHHAKCSRSNFRHERDGKAPC